MEHPLWYAKSTEETLKAFKTSPLGLSSSEAQIRLTHYGLNRLPKTKKQHLITRFFRQFHNVLIYVLLGSALITLLLQHWIDSSVILAVVLVNALIGVIQEGKAEKALDAIRDMLAPTATVLRDGKQQSILAEQLVPGDIIFLEAGNKTPADVRLLQSHRLILQEAILTGESLPVEKSIKAVAEETALGDRSSMAYSGTLVNHGHAKAVVVATGSSTELGHISGLLSQVKSVSTPLLLQMGEFAKFITAIILVVAFFLMAYGYFYLHHPFTELFMAVVSLSVAAIPEGLPAVLTITLAIGVSAMARRNTIVRHLPAIETLGSISVICTDKTGTLTLNEMTLDAVVSNEHVFSIEGVGYQPVGDIRRDHQVIDPKNEPVLLHLARAAALCNDAALHEKDGQWSISGDPMEAALLTFAAKVGLNLHDEQEDWTRTDSIPFDATHRFMASLNHNHRGQAFIFVKGAPEKLLNMCSHQQNRQGEAQALDKAYWQTQIDAIAAKGQRVLALAFKAVKAEQSVLAFSDVEEDLILLGLVGLIDPPRLEAIASVAACYQAGIDVKMITGDHSLTAQAIGKKIGLKQPEHVLRGIDIDAMSDEDLAKAVLETSIYARTSPEHKLRLVMALQSHGLSVAMTGDGVNDAPALKRADAGIAMGITGSEVSKEAADLVLADDNFASIAAAIREGRTVYDNIKKVISWTLPTSSGEALTIIIALLFGMTLPVTPIQILWINLITATTLGMTLAFEPTEENTMRRPPRPRNEPLLSGELAWQTLFVSILFSLFVFGIYFYAIERDYPIDLARSLALNTLVVMEIFHLFFIRNIYGTSLTWKAIKGTKVIWLSVVIITLAQFAITYIPPLQAVFSTVSVPLKDGLLVVLLGVVFFSLIEIEKQLRLYFSKPSSNKKTIKPTL